MSECPIKDTYIGAGGHTSDEPIEGKRVKPQPVVNRYIGLATRSTPPTPQPGQDRKLNEE